MQVYFDSHLAQFFDDGVTVTCNLYDTKSDMNDECLHIQDIVSYIRSMNFDYPITVISIYNMDECIIDQNKYAKVLHKVILAFEALYDNVIIIARVRHDNEKAMEFCANNGFVTYNFMSELEYSEPYLYIDGPLPASIMNYIISNCDMPKYLSDEKGT